MASKKTVENLQLRSSEDLCKLAEMLGYKRGWGDQLQCRNGAFVSSLLDFFDDNPGAMEALVEWVMDNHDLDEEGLDEEACPGCGCLPGAGVTEGCEDPHGCGVNRVNSSKG